MRAGRSPACTRARVARAALVIDEYCDALGRQPMLLRVIEASRIILRSVQDDRERHRLVAKRHDEPTRELDATRFELRLADAECLARCRDERLACQAELDRRLVASADPRHRSGWAVIRPATGRGPAPVCLSRESPGLARLEPIPQTVVRGRQGQQPTVGVAVGSGVTHDVRRRRWIRIVTRPGMKRDSQHREQGHRSSEAQGSASHPIRP